MNVMLLNAASKSPAFYFDCTVLSRARVRDNVMQNVSRTRGMKMKHSLKMIINNVTVTPVCALWHTTMSAGHVSQLSIIKLFVIIHFRIKQKMTFTSE